MSQVGEIGVLREALSGGALLTDEQNAKVKELIGEPFKEEIVFEEP
jgi:hypothetical protein